MHCGAPEQLHVPRETGLEGRGLGGPRGDLERREDEDDRPVGQLPDGVVRLARKRRRKLEAQVGDDVLDGLREDLPRVRPEAVPLAGGEEKDHVDEAAEDPAYHAYEMPVPSKAELAMPRHGDYGGVALLLVQGVVELVLWHLLSGKAGPLRARPGVVVPEELGIGGQDLYAAADEQRDKDDVYDVGDTDPGRKVQLGHLISSLRLADPYDVGLSFECQVHAVRRLPRGYPGDARRTETFLLEFVLQIHRLHCLQRLSQHDDQHAFRRRVDVEGVAGDGFYLPAEVPGCHLFEMTPQQPLRIAFEGRQPAAFGDVDSLGALGVYGDVFGLLRAPDHTF